jgi:hypothetical protein
LAEESSVKKVPAGMEIITLGATNVLVPEGMSVEKKKGLIVIEDIATYISREIEAIHHRLDGLESKNSSLQEAIDEIKDRLEEGDRQGSGSVTQDQ